MTLSELAFPEKGNLKFHGEKNPLEQYNCKQYKKNKQKKVKQLFYTQVINHKFCKIHKISPNTNLYKTKHIYTNIRHNVFKELVPSVLLNEQQSE